MLAPKCDVGSWVSEAAREKFMAAYERAFALWPQPCEEFDIETATATTRVHAYRPHPDGPPVVLLTGAGFNASGWYPHVAALATHHPVYGVDMPGDPNPSVRVGVVPARGGKTVWVKLPIEPGKDYIPRFGWVDDKTLWIETLTRDHKHRAIYFADAASGRLSGSAAVPVPITRASPLPMPWVAPTPRCGL